MALGERWAAEAAPGWVIGLSGDLGAGKTQLVKGFARGLGVTEPVRSPTFALVNEYADGRLPLAHLDFYRLDRREQITAAGLEEYLIGWPGVTIVEWIERWLGETSTAILRETNPLARFRWARLTQTSEEERQITYEDFGA